MGLKSKQTKEEYYKCPKCAKAQLHLHWDGGDLVWKKCSRCNYSSPA